MTPDWRPAEVVAFWRYVSERYAIFRRRVIERRPPPWTTDPILAGVSFTNAYRELDRGTRFVFDTIIPDWRKYPARGVFACIVYRVFNYPPTYRALAESLMLDQWQARGAVPVIEAVRARTGTYTSGAYMITPGALGIPKSVVLADRLQRIFDQWPEAGLEVRAAPTLEAAHARLRKFHGIGGFLAYEIAIDLCYDGWALGFSEDDWVHLGPGAVRGMALLRTDPHESVAVKTAAARALQATQDPWRAEYGEPLPAWVTLRNVEHNLCEFFKYRRATVARRTKRRYAPDRANGDLTPWATLGPPWRSREDDR